MEQATIIGENSKPAVQRAADRVLAVCKKTAPDSEEAMKQWAVLVLRAQVDQLEKTILSLIGKKGRQRHFRKLAERLNETADNLKGPLVGL
ncbi:MAG: hypothetical protein RX318_03880 [bacterium]|nr:hypothetical protein [bacterium]